MLDANTRAAVAVMTAAREEPGACVVLAGSIEEPRGDEAPVSPYAAAKAAATGYARLFHAQDDLPVTVLRIAMVYGPDQPDVGKLVPHVCTALARGIAPSVGSGTRGVDWVYIEDVVEALVLAAVRPEALGHVLDVGSGRAATIAEVVAELADLAGHAHWPPAPTGRTAVTAPQTPAGDDPDVDDDTVFSQLDEAESLDDPDLADQLDEGVSPNEQPWGTDAWGITPEEERAGQPLAGRLRREDRESRDDLGDDLGDASDTDGELWDDEVGVGRSGRLVLREDGEDFFADDVGIDGAGASAEEAAVHLVEDDR